MTGPKLFKSLCDQGLMGPRPGKIWTESFPSWFRSDLTCMYHLDTSGHSIDTCEQFNVRQDSKNDFRKLREKNHKLREESVRIKEESLALKGENQRLRNEMEKRGLEVRRMNETRQLDSGAELKTLVDRFAKCGVTTEEQLYGKQVNKRT
ncbi:anthranilate synthase alpha [Senna tora]|uniref:Anthranilate synthase alpha n=1 Tax=Senna tora TaxID=362788 RepID=A0A834SEP6_9FABA|nr:anthranilate synthase alpha [Senna tora]